MARTSFRKLTGGHYSGAAAKIRALPRPDAKTVPILAMTADAFESDMRRAREVGMNDYLTKPIDRSKLIATLRDLNLIE